MSSSHSPARSTIDPPFPPHPGLKGGSLPIGTAIVTTSCAHVTEARCPVGYSTSTIATLSGTGALRGSVLRPATSRDHTCNAPEEPVKPVGRLSSYPTHTTATCAPEKPANQLSRSSEDVPDLPATVRLAGSTARAARPVPCSMTI